MKILTYLNAFHHLQSCNATASLSTIVINIVEGLHWNPCRTIGFTIPMLLRFIRSLLYLWWFDSFSQYENDFKRTTWYSTCTLHNTPFFSFLKLENFSLKEWKKLKQASALEQVSTVPESKAVALFLAQIWSSLVDEYYKTFISYINMFAAVDVIAAAARPPYSSNTTFRVVMIQ